MKTHLFSRGMKAFVILAFVSGLMLAQQKEIVIDPDLLANSDRLKVKMGTQWMGKIWQFKFGDYAVTDSKNGWETTTYSGKLFSFKANSSSNQEFSFTLSDKSTGNAAVVNAATAVTTEELNSVLVFENFSIGADQVLSSAENFSALIVDGSDESNAWILVKTNVSGAREDSGFRAFMTNQERTIEIIPTDSNKNGEDKRQFPALGYEFVENDRALCALQYYGGGAFGTNKNVIWLRKDLDATTKLILSAAMTALLQVDWDVMSGMD